MSLLPPNSTELERKLSFTLQGATVAQDADIIRGRKFDPPDSWLDLLIWEYGLGELSPYIQDKRQLIDDGLRWSRIRGTPESLHMALSWGGLRARIVESTPSAERNDVLAQQNYVPYKHFAEYDLITDTLPSVVDICNYAHLAILAQPVRSRLWRLVHGYDRGVLKLSDSALDDAFLDDDSGVYPTRAQLPCLPTDEQQGQIPKLSFRQFFSARVERAQTDVIMGMSITYAYHITAWQSHMPYLDDLPGPNEVWTAITGASTPSAAAIYYGQVWADQPWTNAQDWTNTRIMITKGQH
ncbi:phage tail protein [Rappaport israeli]|uniref:phage tail protein n=1 Tax=Rappaport israeli TaxID=1839807 RepID=UPI000931C8B5|nr:phage tail protein [Rappaport israeli]